MATTRKLIEVALPLEAINAAAAHEKSVPRRGHPATMHLWWARRPLAAARAVLFAQLVDDPSSHPDRFPDDESVKLERKRLHNLIERLVPWKNSADAGLLAEAYAEILASTNGNPPPILDPFCGGGTIPLEAQRLGLEAHGSDLNPVAVLITKALIEIPPKFAGRPPVFPGLDESQIRSWSGGEGLAADVRAYGQWMRDEAEKRIGHLYPKATLPDGSTATVIAWIWARTVICPNPACGIEMPLVRSWWLGKKPGKEAYVEPYLVADRSAPGGRKVEFSIGHDPAGSPTPDTDGTVSGRTGAVCVACQANVAMDRIKSEGIAGRLGATLMATVAEGRRQRAYLAPTPMHVRAARVEPPGDVPEQELGYDPRNLWTPAYGLTHFGDLFTTRQLTALTTFSDLVGEARAKALADAIAAGLPDGQRLDAGGRDAAAYADAVASMLAFALSKLADWSSSLCTWIPIIEGVRDTFARQALPMAWDFTEINPLSRSVGNVSAHVDWVAETLSRLGHGRLAGRAVQVSAGEAVLDKHLISTDPPYYDNIGYSDLSDFFYVWLRRSLRNVHPRLLSTLLVPKADELVANPYRHEGKEKAAAFFESGFERFFTRARQSALLDFPITVFYAFKQSETKRRGEASTGWETLLEGMLHSGWAITGTWPMRSERGGRMISIGTNALASSIVLALRPRPDDAPRTDRKGFIAALRAELPERLRELVQGRIAPVDLPQAAIGPGMAIFSRYAAVVEGDGSPMRVRAALAHINEALGEVQTELEGDFDPTTRFALAWFRQHGYVTGSFGAADDLARARATAVETIARTGILTSGGGKVALIRPADLLAAYDPERDEQISVWEVLHHTIRVLEAAGIAAAGELLAQVDARPDGAVDLDLVKELAFLLFAVAEHNRWTKEAVSFNAVATAWPDLLAATRTGGAGHEQTGFDFPTDDSDNDGES